MPAQQPTARKPRCSSPVRLPKLSLAVQYTCGVDHMPLRAQVRRWAMAAVERDVVLTIRFVAPSEARALNRDFRGKDYATNVLTFVYENTTGIAPKKTKTAPQGLGKIEGDIAICPSVIAKEAKEQKKTQHAHFAHMVIHGILHLQAYDHELKKDAVAMEAREIEILRTFKIANPYE
jgi:probable rRNA maturation factor